MISDHSRKPLRSRSLRRPLLLMILASLASTTLCKAQMVGVDLDSTILYEVSTIDASLSFIGNTGVSLGSLAYRSSDGFLYGFTRGRSSSLYRIDPATASANLVGPLGGGFVFEGGLALSPSGVAYGTNQNISTTPMLFSVDLDNGSATTIGTISGGPHDINGLAWRSDGMLVGLDRITNSLLEIDPGTANSSVIAAVSSTVGAAGGMTVDGNTAYFATGGPGSSEPGSNELYSFDLFSGTQTLVGSFSPTITGNGISGLAFVPEPGGLLVAICGAGLCLAAGR